MITVSNPRSLVAAFRVAIILAVLLPWATGCGNSSNTPTGRVRGRVTYEGEPVEEGAVSLYSGEFGSGASGVIGRDGTYTISDPLRTGEYTVSVFPPSEPPPQDAIPVASGRVCDNIPEKYRDPQKSGLMIDVKEGKNIFDINMTK
jgi:hypothetical protein